jgi:hypothetical protein
MHRRILAIFLSSLISVAAVAQQGQQTTPDAPAPSEQQNHSIPGQSTLKSGVAIYMTLQKKSVIFPDLATKKPQLTGWEKCQLAANTSVSLPVFGAALLGAGIGQARNQPAGYGQGWEGYGKRLGAGMARSASYNLFGPCLIATATHEDPRFFVKKLGFKDTLKYAAIRLVYTRTDTGERVFNYSGIGGTLAAEGLANVYYPEGSRSFGDTMIRFSTDMATRYAGHLLRQYLPLIDKKLGASPQ